MCSGGTFPRFPPEPNTDSVATESVFCNHIRKNLHIAENQEVELRGLASDIKQGFHNISCQGRSQTFYSGGAKRKPGGGQANCKNISM